MIFVPKLLDKLRSQMDRYGIQVLELTEDILESKGSVKYHRKRAHYLIYIFKNECFKNEAFFINITMNCVQ